MTLDDIEADVIYVLTLEIDRLFRFAGCDPTCHYCDQLIKVGDKFKLAYCKGVARWFDEEVSHERDIMLCDNHTAKQQIEKDKQEVISEIQAYKKSRRGFSRSHKVV